MSRPRAARPTPRPIVHPRPAPPRPRAAVAKASSKKKAWRWPSRIGPFQLKSQNGRNVLAIGFAGQLQGELLFTDVGDDEQENSANPKLRRIRLTLGGSFLSKHLKYCLQLSTAPKSLEIMDFYLEYRFLRHLRLRVGQYKIPFTNHRAGSFKARSFVDWSILVPGFGSERQLGMHLHNDGSAASGFFYAFGVYIGQNARRAHNRLYARTWGESLSNPSDLSDPAPLERIHPEFVVRLTYKTADISTKHDADFTGGKPRAAFTLGLAWDLDPTHYREQSLRGVAEVLFKARYSSLYAALYVASGRKDSQLSQRFAMLGALWQTSYLIKRRYQLAMRYALVHFDGTLLNSARRRAGELISAETDPVLRDALVSQYSSAGTIQREHTVTLGFNIYLIGDYLKIQLDLSWLGHERAAGLLHDIRSRLQLQLTF